MSVVRYVSDRIAVIHKGRIVELAETEELFKNSLHPYTQSLLSAVPMPDPQIEKNKELIVYSQDEHDYSVAAISHVPHLIAASLVNLVKDNGSDKETIAEGNVKIKKSNEMYALADKCVISAGYDKFKIIGKTKTQIYGKQGK